MTTAVPEPEGMDGLLEHLPEGQSQQGRPGQDQAGERARAIRALTLRVVGNMTYSQIAQQMGYREPSSVRQLILRALDRHEGENVRQMRTMENQRLDADEMVLRTIILDTNSPASTRIRAIDSRTRLSARRSRMNGLDAPIAVQISAGVAVELEDALGALESLIRESTVPGEVLTSTDEALGDDSRP